MSASPTEQQQVVWEVLAQFWVDTWYDTSQLDRFADRLAASGFSVRELDRIAYCEVCGAFAIFSLAVFLSAGMALHDWHFPEDEARRRVSAWLARPRILSFINPVWIGGYVVARCFLRQTWPELRGRVAQRLASPAGQ